MCVYIYIYYRTVFYIVSRKILAPRPKSCIS